MKGRKRKEIGVVELDGKELVINIDIFLEM